MSDEIIEPEIPEQGEEVNESIGDQYGPRPDRPLSPRHRKLAELLARGLTNNEIAKELHYDPARISVLKSNSQIRALAEELREKIYEDTVGSRLKRMAEPALNLLEDCLKDQTRKFREKDRLETAKWVVEKLDGKPTQRYDVGENLIGVLFDRLDAIKTNAPNPNGGVIDVTPSQTLSLTAPQPPPNEEQKLTPEDDYLKNWVDSL